jgi:hypothetical protein
MGVGAATYSYMTIETASFKILSPKMMVYSLGSTLYVLKMARIVTGSVAESVDPKMRHSKSVNRNPSRPNSDQTYTRTLGGQVSVRRCERFTVGILPEADGRDEGPHERKSQNDTEISEEVFLRASPNPSGLPPFEYDYPSACLF